MRTLAVSVAILFQIIFATLAISNQSIGSVAESKTVDSKSAVESTKLMLPLNQPTRVGLPTGIGAIKSLPDGFQVLVSEKLLTAIFDSRFYVEEADRSSGIKVVCPSELLSFDMTNSLVTFSGIMETVHGERQIRLTSPIQIDNPSVPPLTPLSTKQFAIGGYPFIEPTPKNGQILHLQNLGLLMFTFGYVTSSDGLDITGTFCYIDDGSHIVDGSYNFFDPDQTPFVGLRVFSYSTPPQHTYKYAVGISGLYIFDPTPDTPTSGDEIPIRTLYVPYNMEIGDLGASGIPTSFISAGGRVRLDGNPPRTVPVRVYSSYSDAVLQNVGSDFQPFSLRRVPSKGTIVTACAPGYKSQTKVLSADCQSVDFVLQPIETYISISADKNSIRACSNDTVNLNVLFRDAEGRHLSGRNLRITTSQGTFLESGQNVIDTITDASGYANVTLTVGTSAPGEARIHVTEYSDTNVSAEAAINISGPSLNVQATPSDLSAPGTANIAVTLTQDGQPVPNARLTAITDLGVFDESSSQFYATLTGEDGTANITLRLDQPGTARIAVCNIDACGNDIVSWVLVSYGTQPWVNKQAYASSPLVADLDNSNDGHKEIAFVNSDGVLYVIKSDGSVLWQQEGKSFGDNTPACGDLDHDPEGSLEVVLASEFEARTRAYCGANGIPLAGWPTYADYPFIKVSAAVADVNSDGANEVIAGDQSCFVFSWNGTGNWEKTTNPSNSCLWRNLTGSSGTAIYNSSVAIGDIDGDPAGIPEVVVGSNDVIEVFSFPGDAWGNHVNPPLYTSGWPKSTGLRVQSSPAIGDIDGDGMNDMTVGCDDGCIYVYNGGTQDWLNYKIGSIIRSSPALADLDEDGNLDIIFGADDGRIYAIHGDGTPVAGWEGGIKLNPLVTLAISGSPAVGDVNGDGKLEVLIGSGEGFLYCLYNDGMNHILPDGSSCGPIAWAKKCAPAGESSSIVSCPTIDDIDGNGKIDIIVTSSAGLYRFEIDAPYVASPQTMPWPTFRGNMQRTGCATPPEPPVYASIVGKVTRLGSPVYDAKVYITKADGSPVYAPSSNQTDIRPPVRTVGSSGASEINKGGYSINQLQRDTTYTLRVVATGLPEKIVPDIHVTTGVIRVDIEL